MTSCHVYVHLKPNFKIEKYLINSIQFNSIKKIGINSDKRHEYVSIRSKVYPDSEQIIHVCLKYGVNIVWIY